MLTLMTLFLGIAKIFDKTDVSWAVVFLPQIIKAVFQTIGLSIKLMLKYEDM